MSETLAPTDLQAFLAWVVEAIEFVPMDEGAKRYLITILALAQQEIPSSPPAVVEAKKSSELQAGWGIWPGLRKWHYFPAGDIFSLCRKVGFFWGARYPSDDAAPDNCAACQKMLAARGHKEGR